MSLKNPVTPPGIDPGAVRLNHYATPGPNARSTTLYFCVVFRNFTARRVYQNSARSNSFELFLSFQFPSHSKHKVSQLHRPTNNAV